jgi:hypothetical protein
MVTNVCEERIASIFGVKVDGNHVQEDCTASDLKRPQSTEKKEVFKALLGSEIEDEISGRR